VALNILAVSSEAFPLAKTGGLGDAVGGLAQALLAEGVSMTLMLPAYRGVVEQLRDVRHVAQLNGLPGGSANLLAGHCDKLGSLILLVQNDALYDRDGLYVDDDGKEYEDNAVRFAALSQAAARVAEGIVSVPRPDIVHIHDWHAALTPVYMRQLQIPDVKTVLTLHNIAFQGVFAMEVTSAIGIEERYCTASGGEFWGRFNFLKAGIEYSDLITVVSHHYAQEILTPRFGCGLEGVLAERQHDLISIPNGIDTTLWNPEADVYLPGCSFDRDDLHNKAVCKELLQKKFGLYVDPNVTVMAMGSRLTTQKMADVAIAALPIALDTHPGLQVCILGHGDKGLEQALIQLAKRYPRRVSAHIGFDESKAHLLHAGSDILLHGSRFEPFGLTPLYSMRYGTIPIGSRVGGMVDTIKDPGDAMGPRGMQTGTGILFDGEQPMDMVNAIARAMQLHSRPEVWLSLQRNAMSADFSWAKTAPVYLRAYQALQPRVVLDGISERRRAAGRTSMSAPASAFAVKAKLAKPGRRSARTDVLDAPPGASAA
jgi:starch synthase